MFGFTCNTREYIKYALIINSRPSLVTALFQLMKLNGFSQSHFVQERDYSPRSCETHWFGFVIFEIKRY